MQSRKSTNAKGCPQLPDITQMKDSCAYYLISLFILSREKSLEMSKKRTCTFRLVFKPTLAAASLGALTFPVVSSPRRASCSWLTPAVQRRPRITTAEGALSPNAHKHTNLKDTYQVAEDHRRDFKQLVGAPLLPSP